MPLGLPNQIRELLNQTIIWEKFVSNDSHADSTYAAPVTLNCWIEERGAEGGVIATRSPSADTYEPRYDVYFDAIDVNAKTIGMEDRFTAPGIAGGERLKPVRVNTFYGSLGIGDNWVVVITL